MRIRSLLVITFVSVLLGCTSGSDEFSDALGDSDGGEGTASIAISSYSPGLASLAIKDVQSQQFLVSAVGRGDLVYKWTLDGSSVGGDSPTYQLTAGTVPVGHYELKVTINDTVGTISQVWDVKINGSPVIASATPQAATAHLRRNSTLDYSVSVTDPNSDALTYVWKLDGQEGVLTATAGTASWTPASVDVGSHTVAVDIYDGAASDTSTYKVTRSWTTYVNHFSTACNQMENLSQTNMACVLSGIPGIGDGLNPTVAPSSFYIRPTAFALTAQNNLFIADDANHVVWFYNKNTSPSTTVLGVTVPVGTMKVVAGIGVASNANTASVKALRTFLNNPHGLYWDGSNLYIAEASNDRVVRVNSSGDLTAVLTAGCAAPRGMTMTGGYLYVACHGSNIISRVDPTTLVRTTFAGTGAAGNPANLNASTFTDATNGRLNGPYAMTSDSSGNIYVGEHTGCRVRMYNMSGSAITLYGTYVIPAGNQRIIAGAAAGPSCGTTIGEPVDMTGATNGLVGNTRDLMIDADGNLLIAVDQDVVQAIHFGAGTDSVYGTSVTGYIVRPVFGSGTAGYLGEGQTPLLTRLNNPFALAQDSSTHDVYVGDRDNLRMRRVRASDTRFELLAGNGALRGQTNAGQGQLEAGQEKMNAIRGLAVDKVTGEVFVADGGNNRIRVINRYGQVSQAVGTGSSGSGAEENEFPSNSTMNTPRGLVMVNSTATFGGHLVWADSANHRIRIWNRSLTDQVLYGVPVSAGMVATIGGDGTVGNATSGSALQPAFNTPSGVTYYDGEVFIADMSNHCIKKISATGTLSAVAGTCGTSGNVNGPVGTGRMTSPEGIDYYVNGVHRGLVIAARGNTRVKFHRLAGPSLLFGGSTSVGDTNSIACGGTFHTENINANLAPCGGVYDVAMVGTKVCFTNFNYHNVRCILPTGEISTAIGPPQGIDDTLPLYSPGGSFAHEDFNSSSPNYASQNGVQAFYIPATLTGENSLTTSYGQVNYPMPMRPIDDSTILVGEHYLGLVRKVKLP